MRMAWRGALLTLAAAGASATTGACSDDPPPPRPTCPKDNPECREIATVEAGSEAVQKRNCVDCHGGNMAGKLTPLPGFPKTPSGEDVELYPPNLTRDKKT